MQSGTRSCKPSDFVVRFNDFSDPLTTFFQKESDFYRLLLEFRDSDMKQAFLTEELATLLRVQSHTCAPSSAWETKADRAAAVSRFHPQRPPGVHVEAFSVCFIVFLPQTLSAQSAVTLTKMLQKTKNYGKITHGLTQRRIYTSFLHHVLHHASFTSCFFVVA